MSLIVPVQDGDRERRFKVSLSPMNARKLLGHLIDHGGDALEASLALDLATVEEL